MQEFSKTNFSECTGREFYGGFAFQFIKNNWIFGGSVSRNIPPRLVAKTRMAITHCHKARYGDWLPKRACRSYSKQFHNTVLAALPILPICFARRLRGFVILNKLPNLWFSCYETTSIYGCRLLAHSSTERKKAGLLLSLRLSIK